VYPDNFLCGPVPTGFGTPPGQTASEGVEAVIIVFLYPGQTDRNTISRGAVHKKAGAGGRFLELRGIFLSGKCHGVTAL